MFSNRHDEVLHALDLVFHLRIKSIFSVWFRWFVVSIIDLALYATPSASSAMLFAPISASSEGIYSSELELGLGLGLGLGNLGRIF